MLPLVVCALTCFLSVTTAQYVIEDDYEPSSFASMFDFYTGTDPTNGYVTYVDQTTAEDTGLYSTQNGSVYMGVDYTNIASGSGRSSTRITSKKSYNHGLIILDLEHMPGGVCGTWPAFWMLGPNWPTNGELDIIEGVNSRAANTMTLHTDSGCSITNSGTFSGTIETSNCDVNAANQPANQGCAIDSSNTATYGSGFNSVSGGVYATQWTSDAINIWFFPRSAIPSDITSGNPDPSGWGLALSTFAGDCDLDSHVDNMQIVFDNTFCGDWAGTVWSTDATCSSLASTCEDYVQNNPLAFTDAYWLVNSLKVYQSDNAVATSTPSASASSTVTSTSTSTSSFVTSFSTSTTYTTSFATSTSFITTFSTSTSLPFFSSTSTSFSNQISLTASSSTPTAFTTPAFTQSSLSTSYTIPTSTPSLIYPTPASIPSTFSYSYTASAWSSWSSGWPPVASQSWVTSYTDDLPAPTQSWGQGGGWNGGNNGGNGGGWR